MSYRDDVLAALDVRRFYESQVEIGPSVGRNEFRIRCPFHDDRDPSANVNLESGFWHCHSEDIGGGPIDWLMRKGMATKDAINHLGELAGVQRERSTSPAPAAAETRRSAKSKLSQEQVEAWHAAAMRNADLMAWFADKRGFVPGTIAQWELGWDGSRVTIPIRDADGKLVNVRRYLRNAPQLAGKMLSITTGAGAARLWPLPLPDGDLIVCEGEWDMILLRQHGFTNALTVTSGAGIFNPEWVPLFADRVVTLIYDNDDAGRRGAQKVARMLGQVAQVFVLQIPGLPDKGDPTDFFVEQGRTDDELTQLIADATPYVVSSTIHAEPDTSVPVSLAAASDAKYHGVRLETPVLLSGKAMTPFVVPSKFRAHCGVNNKRFCGICPMAEVNGERQVTLSAADPAVLSMVGVSDESRVKAMKEIADAVPACNLIQFDVTDWTNIEELRLIPELDAGVEAGEQEYVARQGFFLGHGLKPNAGYTMRGYAHPHPKSQATVHLLSEADPAQDNISAFAMTPELCESLKVFQVAGDPEPRLRDIYSDFAASVHRIQDRFDMQVAYDLVWHSAIAFHFNGAYVRRGWVEAMVMSDTGQGKTEMAATLLQHYRLGERVQAEQSSTAGLLGGLEKMGDTWLLSWGRLPLNDKRLLIVDETQGLAAAAIEGLSDVRATGVAEITKIRTERTNARCRILWLANPKTGLTLAQHNQGVLAIKELFTKPEDIRRLDFALTLASDDVDYARAINVAHGAAKTPRYASPLCRSLILWAWSRRPEQVVFTEDATEEILAAATEQGRKYHASIPLVQPSDQRLKLARLAAAVAARVFSCDESGEQLIVTADHVRFIVTYLERVYNARSMSYGEYSGQQSRGESVSDDDRRTIANEIEGWANRDNALDFLRQARIFKKSELEDVLGWDSDYVKSQLRFLSSHRLIRSAREGYVKTSAFITFLRGIALDARIADQVEEALANAKF